MKYFYKGFALGYILFSGFSFATENDISEKPTIEVVDDFSVEFLGEDISVKPDFVIQEVYPIKDEEVFIKEEYYDSPEDNIFYTGVAINDDINEETIYTLEEIKRTLSDDGTEITPELLFIEDTEFPVAITDEEGVFDNELIYMTMTANMNMDTDTEIKPEITNVIPVSLPTEPTSDNIEAIKQAMIGDTEFIKAEIEKDFEMQIGSEDRILLTDAIEKHLLNNTMDATVHATKVIADGGWAEHLRKKGLLPIALEDTFGKNIIPPAILQTVSAPVAHNGGMNHTMGGNTNMSVSEPFGIMALLSACIAFMSTKRRKEV